MLVYDDQGTMINGQVSKFIQDLDHQVSDFLQDLFDQGMTIPECMALRGDLEAQISAIVTFQMLLNCQPVTKEDEENESTRLDNGTPAAQT